MCPIDSIGFVLKRGWFQAYNQAAPVVKDVTDTAAPYVKKGLETANEVAAPVVRAAEPVVKVCHRIPPIYVFFNCRTTQEDITC